MKSQIILFFAVTALFIHCKQDKQAESILLEYKMMDDVSPVKTTIWATKDFHWSEWLIDDVALLHNDTKDKLEFVFEKEGVSKVQFNASGAGGKKYTGFLFLDIPPVANNLLIDGFYIKNHFEPESIDDFLICEINYYNGIQYQNLKFEIQKSVLTNEDTVKLNNTVSFDIAGFETDRNGDKFWAYFWLKGNKSKTIYFKSNFYLYTENFIHRHFLGNRIHLFNISESNPKEVFLLVDWTRL
jgi:hypothetical protein